MKDLSYMHPRDQKQAVLHQLIQELDPLSLRDLLEKLGGGYAERSVRRWLAEMVEEGLVEKLGRKRGTRYQAIKRSSQRRAGMPSSCFGSESFRVIEQVRRPIYERMPVAYVEEWLDAYHPNVTFYISSHFRSQLHQAGKRSQQEDPAGTYAHQIFNRLLIDLSYNSSRLEGNTYSLLDTQRLVLKGESAEGKLDQEKIMILNHKEAIRYLVDAIPHLNITQEVICTLHYLLADGLVDAQFAGKIRDHGVRIAGSTYVPFEDPKRIEIQLRRIIEKALLIEDPYERSIFLLVHISYLQAFTDVNKRTARLSANIPLVMHNLVPLSFNDVEQEDYTSAMIAIYELNDVRPIIDLYIFSYMRTCAMYNSTVKTLGFDEVRVRYRSLRRALIRSIILDGLTGEALKEYITSQANQSVPEKDQSDFLIDVYEDLEYLDPSRIAGLGITVDQLEEWKKHY